MKGQNLLYLLHKVQLHVSETPEVSKQKKIVVNRQLQYLVSTQTSVTGSYYHLTCGLGIIASMYSQLNIA